MEKDMHEDQLHPDATAHIVNSQNLKHLTPQSDIPDPKKPKRKFHIPVIAIIFAAFIGLLILMEGGLYLAKQSKNKTSLLPTPLPVSQISPTPNPIENWQTFQGDKYSFMYPADWSIDNNKPNNILVGPISSINHLGSTVPEYISPYITLVITTASPNTDLIKYSKIDASLGAVWENINIDNIEGHIVTHMGCESGTCRDVFFQKDNKIYNFSEQNNLQEFEQLLKTFKFTDPSLSCTPRPACLDSNPRCLIPETDDMCPVSSSSQKDVLITPPSGANPGGSMVACTMEAKLCPDGVTSVGRSGPKCEFEKCPGE